MKILSALSVSLCLALAGNSFADAAVAPVRESSPETKAGPTQEDNPAPLSKAEQEQLAKAMLSKGICNVAFYGEVFCTKQSEKSFKVTDQFGTASDQNVSTEDGTHH